MSLEFIPARQFTLEALTQVYNQTRVDYLVPMSMNAGRLGAYLNIYDVDLDHSVVVVEGAETLGLGMLGVREKRGWVTRLGVLPHCRRRGVGADIMRYLLRQSDGLGLERTLLEVIAGNSPGRQLFLRQGYQEIRFLLILKRVPACAQPDGKMITAWYVGDEALVQFAQRIPAGQAWTNQIESLRNAGDAMALQITLPGGASGWLFFRRQETLLSHFTFHTDRGDPVRVARGLLAFLYQRFPEMETYTENIALTDPHLPALWQSGFGEVFRRIEMHRDRAPGG